LTAAGVGSSVGADGVRRDSRGRKVRTPQPRPTYTADEMAAALSVYEQYRAKSRLGELPRDVRAVVQAAWRVRRLERAARAAGSTPAPGVIYD
jgi:hypothetical protein